MTRASVTLDDVALPSRPTSRPAQQSALARIAGWCHDHRWWVLSMWLAALVLSNVFAQLDGSAFSNNLSGGKQQAQQILNANFPTQSGSPAQVVVTTGTAFTGSVRAPLRSRETDISPTCASSLTSRLGTCLHLRLKE